MQGSGSRKPVGYDWSLARDKLWVLCEEGAVAARKVKKAHPSALTPCLQQPLWPSQLAEAATTTVIKISGVKTIERPSEPER